MSRGSRDEVIVAIDAWQDQRPRDAGRLRRSGFAQRSDVAFEYDPAWLDAADSFDLDPSLELRPGEQRRRAAGQLHPIFTDAAPDRWGQKLLNSREVTLAKREGRAARPLEPFDLLIRVNDATRMGAIRLKRPADGKFVDDSELGVPPKADLRELEAAADRIERGAKASEGERAAWLEKLIAPGASLGGARPKATFENSDGAMWMAKFPAPTDLRDKGAWEYVMGRLALRARLTVPEHGLLSLGPNHHTFIARRFDRQGSHRVMFASAMTLCDQGDHPDDAGYLDIATAIELHGTPTESAIAEDLEQLYRRVVFNAVTGHRDDHLRNHGFLHDGKGWRLSPAFDLNPMPEKVEHELAFDDSRTTRPDLEIIAATSRHYRLTTERAAEVISEVRDAVSAWRQVAAEIGIDRQEQELVAGAFMV